MQKHAQAIISDNTQQAIIYFHCYHCDVVTSRQTPLILRTAFIHSQQEFSTVCMAQWQITTNPLCFLLYLFKSIDFGWFNCCFHVYLLCLYCVHVDIFHCMKMHRWHLNTYDNKFFAWIKARIKKCFSRVWCWAVSAQRLYQSFSTEKPLITEHHTLNWLHPKENVLNLTVMESDFLSNQTPIWKCHVAWSIWPILLAAVFC